MTTLTAPRTHVPAAPPSDLPAGGLTIMLAVLLMAVMDFFAVNVAMPSIGRELDLSSAGLELVVSGYGAAYALLLVAGGRLGDAFGRRGLLMAGVAAFTIASAACAAAPSGWALVAARVAQGASAGFMVPQLLATAQATTSGAARARVLGLYGAAAGLSVVAGQLLGGLFVTVDVAGLGWRAVFLVNVPVGVVVLATARRFVPETFGQRSAIDAWGTVSFAVGVVAVLLPVTLGRAQGWPLWSVVLLGAVIPSLAVLRWAELRAERIGVTPLIPVSLLRVRSARVGLGIDAMFFLCFSGFLFVYSVVMQRIVGASASVTGLVLVPFGLTFLVSSVLTGRSRLTGRALIARGALLQSVGIGGTAAVILAGWPHVSTVWLAVPLAVSGFAQGLVVAPLFRTVLSGVPTHLAGAGAGLLNTVQQLSIGLGAALFGAAEETFAGHSHAEVGFATVLAVQAGAALAIAGSTRRLPR